MVRTLLDPEHLALIDGGVGVSVASRDRALLPKLVRALGGVATQRSDCMAM